MLHRTNDTWTPAVAFQGNISFRNSHGMPKVPDKFLAPVCIRFLIQLGETSRGREIYSLYRPTTDRVSFVSTRPFSYLAFWALHDHDILSCDIEKGRRHTAVVL